MQTNKVIVKVDEKGRHKITVDGVTLKNVHNFTYSLNQEVNQDNPSCNAICSFTLDSVNLEMN